MSMFTAEYQDFKREDPTVLVKVTLYDDQKNVIKPAISKAKLVQGTKYAGEYEITQDGDQYCLSTKQVAKLPSGSYGMELWGDDGSIYPSAGFIPIRIHRNADNSLEQVDPTVDLNKIIEDMHNAGLNLVFDKIELLDSDQPGSITSSVHDGKNHITLRIPRGKTGPMPALHIKSVTQGEPGTQPSVTLEKTDDGYNLGFVIPRTGFTSDQLLTLRQGMRGQMFIYSKDQFVKPYTDLNTIPANTIVTYAYANAMGSLAHAPANDELYTVITFSPDTRERRDGAFQMAIDRNNTISYRFYWSNYWSGWQRVQHVVNITGDWQVVAPFNDLNNLSNGGVIYSVGFNKVAHRPDGLANYFFIETNGDSFTRTQLLTDLATGDMYHRYMLGNTIGSWKKLANTSDIKDQQAQPGGIDVRTPSLSLFSNFGVIGDSYASGTLAKDDGKTFVGGQENLCWPVMLARKWGTKVLRLAEPGLSTQSWLTSNNGLKKLNESDPQDIYYLCLGINDYWQLGMSYLGNEGDMDQGADTFYGNYAKIIRAIKSKAPNAPMIMVGVAADSKNAKAFSEAQKKIANKFNIPFVSERDDGFFTSDYYSSTMKGGHPQAPGYAAMALAIERLIQKTIINNPTYFNQYGW